MRPSVFVRSTTAASLHRVSSKSAAPSIIRAIEARRDIISSRKRATHEELQALMRLAGKSLLPTMDKKSSLSASAIISATAFKVSTVREAQTIEADTWLKHHHERCSFVGEAMVPLHKLYKDELFRESPCLGCATKRLHHIASEDFAHDLANRSVLLQRPSLTKNEVLIPEDLSAALASSFGSVEKAIEEIRLYCSSRRASGFTWLAWNNVKQRIVVLNPPRNQSPTVLGLWPLAAFDMSDGTVSSAYRALVSESGTAHAGETPLWSRAARVPASAVTRTAVQEEAAQHLALSDAVALLADFYVSAAAWEHIAKQLAAARAYYASETRQKQRAARTEELAAAAKKASLAQWTQASQDDSGTDATQETNVSTRSGVSNDASTASSSSSSAELGAATGSQEQPPQSDEEFTVSTNGAGVTTYEYRDGRRTVVDSVSGITVFYTAEVTTTVYPDQTTHFLYQTGAELWRDKDGNLFSTKPDTL